MVELPLHNIPSSGVLLKIIGEFLRLESKNKKLYYVFVDLDKAFDRVPREVVGWALKKLGVDEWLIHEGMAEACTVVRTYAEQSECWFASSVSTVSTVV